MRPDSADHASDPLLPATSRRALCRTLGGLAATVAAGTWLGAAASDAAAATKAGAPAPKDSEIGFKEGKFVLPPLPYAPDALEPAIDKETMSLHHDKHHQAYVTGANTALEALGAIAKGGGDPKLVGHWQNELAFNASGHFLHLLFWNNLKPGGGKPAGELAAAIDKSFGGQPNFERLFAATAGAVQGSGWALLGYEAVSQSLVVLSAEKHQNLTIQSVTPILALDVWEHAYYLKYQNRRADYVKAFLGIVNYDAVAARLAAAREPASA